MITSPLLASFPEILHAFGTKTDASPEGPLVTMNQIHGVNLHWVDRPMTTACDNLDGILSRVAGVSLAVKTADCVPLLLFDPGKKYIAAVHSGWRGTLKKIVLKAIQELQAKGSKPAELRVAIGPCIRDCCFEVEHDVANPFQKQFPRWREFMVPHPSDKKKSSLDLQECNRILLGEAGVLPENIDVIPLCTHCREDLFHSVRRDGDQTGRMMSFIRLL